MAVSNFPPSLSNTMNTPGYTGNPYYPNPYATTNASQPPIPTLPPSVPQMQDAERAYKLLSWFNASGLTAEELDALSSLKKNGKDIDSILGIKKEDSSNKDFESMKKDIKDLKDIVSSLVESLTEPTTSNKNSSTK